MRHPIRGNIRVGVPITLEPGPDRISPPKRVSTVYHGPGFVNTPPAGAGTYGKSSLSWEFIDGLSPTATVEGARRSPCNAESCTTAAGFVLRYPCARGVRVSRGDAHGVTKKASGPCELPAG